MGSRWSASLSHRAGGTGSGSLSSWGGGGSGTGSASEELHVLLGVVFVAVSVELLVLVLLGRSQRLGVPDRVLEAGQSDASGLGGGRCFSGAWGSSVIRD